MAPPEGYRVQDGCWNCEHRIAWMNSTTGCVRFMCALNRPEQVHLHGTCPMAKPYHGSGGVAGGS